MIAFEAHFHAEDHSAAVRILFFASATSDCHGLCNPCGSRVGSVTGRVGVEFF